MSEFNCTKKEAFVWAASLTNARNLDIAHPLLILVLLAITATSGYAVLTQDSPFIFLKVMFSFCCMAWGMQYYRIIFINNCLKWAKESS